MDRDFDLVFEGISMRAYTKTIDGIEVKFIGGTASSTAQDLYGSIIGAAAQVMMLEKLRGLAAKAADQKSGLTAWLNHSYKIPEDTLGAFVGASLTTRSENGEDFIDLDIECRVTETNPRALAAWEQVRDGIRHGWSIGAIFLDGEWLSDDPDDDDFWNMLITNINLLEISLVGIPANQRAWCKSVEDLKARAAAVAAAEDIIKAATEKREVDIIEIEEGVQHKTGTMERNVLDVLKQRSLVRRSLMHADDTANSGTTSPITARETTETNEPTESTDTVATCEHVTLALPEDVAAPNPPAVRCDKPKAADSLLCAEHRELALPDTTAEAPAEVEEPAEQPATEQFTLTMSLDTREASVALLDALNAPVTELANELREQAGSDEDSILARAADAIDILSKAATIATRDPEAQTPDDGRDLIGMAVSHLAKGVGHGLCIRSAKHIGAALDCLGSMAANVVDQPEPQGDEDPETLSVKVEKLSPKAGDVLVLHGISAERILALREQWAACDWSQSVVLVCAADDETISYDEQLTQRVAELTETRTSIATATEELTMLSASLEAARTALADAEAALADKTKRNTELDTVIANKENRRLGRGVMETLAQRVTGSESEVQPEHYQATHTEQLAALRRAASAAPAPSGRDIAAAS